MSLTKRGNIWQTNFSIGGQRIRKSTGTGDKQKAKEYEIKLKNDLWQQQKLGITKPRKWEEAVIRWAKENPNKRDLKRDLDKLRWLDQFLRGQYLHEITRDMVEEIAYTKKNEGVTDSTVNRYVSAIRVILNKACNEWDWIHKAPKLRMRTENPPRVRYLTMDEEKRLLVELPEHLFDMARFALNTGLRADNVCQLRWSYVHMDCEQPYVTIPAAEMKNKRTFSGPLNDTAIEIIRNQIGKHNVFVFTYKGSPIARQSNHAWYKALKRAGIVDFRWHDFRHTWASRLVLSGVSLYELKQLGGWVSNEVERYAHLTTSHLYEQANKVNS
jgi:integrase